MSAQAVGPNAAAAAALLLLSLATCALRAEVTSDGYRLARLRQESTTLARRLTWVEVQLGRRLADPTLGAPSDDAAVDHAAERAAASIRGAGDLP